MKCFLVTSLIFSLVGSAFAGGVAGKVTFKDPSKKKPVTISAPAYALSCQTIGDKYQLPLPDTAKGKMITIKVEGGAQTTVKVPTNGYAELNFVFD